MATMSESPTSELPVRPSPWPRVIGEGAARAAVLPLAVGAGYLGAGALIAGTGALASRSPHFRALALDAVPAERLRTFTGFAGGTLVTGAHELLNTVREERQRAVNKSFQQDLDRYKTELAKIKAAQLGNTKTASIADVNLAYRAALGSV